MSATTSTISPRELQDRLLDKATFDPARKCWLFTGHRIKDRYGKLGYGQIGVGRGRLAVAHRVSYELFCGPIPPGKMVLHTCDVRRCVNPVHLFIGDNTANVKDALAKGRFSEAERHYNTALVNSQVAKIKRRLAGARVKRRLFPGLAKEFNTTVRVIEGIAYGKAWRSVEPCQPSGPA